MPHREICAIGVLMVLATATGAEGRSAVKADFYVSPNGSDKWSGPLADPNRRRTDGPFATIRRARDAARELRQRRPDGSITILIRGGVDRLTIPSVFTPQ